MKSRMVVSILLLVVCFALLGNMFYKLINGNGIVLNDVIYLSLFLFFSFLRLHGERVRKKTGFYLVRNLENKFNIKVLLLAII